MEFLIIPIAFFIAYLSVAYDDKKRERKQRENFYRKLTEKSDAN